MEKHEVIVAPTKTALEDKTPPEPVEPKASTSNSGQEETGVYTGELLSLQLGAFMKWKEADDYKNAYFQKKTRRRRRPDWNPQSREYTIWATSSMHSVDWSSANPWSVGKFVSIRSKYPMPF
ncbi:unnamed protein product [Calypogeia fissa]